MRHRFVLVPTAIPLLAALLAIPLGTELRADVVTDWNSVFLDTIRATGGPPCPIARAGAILHAAVYDAVNSIERTHERYRFSLPASPAASCEAAAAAAAHRVLVSLYPSRAAVFDAALAASLAAVPDGPGETEGVDLGQTIADLLVAARAADGTSVDPPYAPGGQPGDWRPTPPDFTSPPFNPGWGQTQPWTMLSGEQFRPAGPLGFADTAALLASPEYAAQVDDVRELGSLASATRTAYETETAYFWANDRNGTFKPPGHLNAITQVVSQSRGLSLVENARLFALVNLAMADAGLVAWDAKYRTPIDLWRPVTAIQEADTDGNPLSTADPSWEPLNPFTPPFPAYISGHATFAAVHAAVMRGFFASDEVTFTITSDDTPGVFRTYSRFSDAALENGRSRVFLGVHFQFDADDGYTAGSALGDHVIAGYLRPLAPFVRCDANSSGVVDISDAIWSLNEFFRGGPTAACREAGDCNGDGDRDISDTVYLVRFLFQSGSMPPAPFPSCGTDLNSTADSCPPETAPCVMPRSLGDPSWVRRWNRIAIDAAGLDHTPVGPSESRTFGEQIGPCRSSRALAIVHIAIFEAINAVAGGYDSYLGLEPVPGRTSVRAAIARAAHDTLAAMYPSQAAAFALELAADLRDVPNGVAKDSGLDLGRRAAAAILSRRAGDGSAHPEPLYGTDYVPSNQPGKWRQDPISLVPIALGARWDEVAPFVMTSASQFRAPIPPALTSPEYTTAYGEVQAAGGDGVTTATERTADETFIGTYWAYDGTPSLCAPPRLYNQIAVQIATQQGVDIVDLARLLALANVAMADAGIAVWESKYFFEYWRPVTGIREADPGTGPTGAGDGNPDTSGDASYSPLGAPASNLAGPNFTPPFPAYPSGHAGFGGALFQTLRRFFGTDNIPFTFVSDEYNGATRDNTGAVRPLRPRSFVTLSQAEEENGQSRIYLGIHWSFDKTAGIAQGRSVAEHVSNRLFLPLP